MKKIDNIISIMENICMILLGVYMALDSYCYICFLNAHNQQLTASPILLMIISILLIIFCSIDLFRKFKNIKNN